MGSRERHNSRRVIRWSLAVASFAFGCGRDPLGVSTRDAGPSHLPATHDAAQILDVTPDAAPDRAMSDAPLAADVAGRRDDVAGADACVPLLCRDPTCDPPYCGKIGDGCGGILDCGDDCPPGWTCGRGMCRPPPALCTPTRCNSLTHDYCGVIGDGCGGALDCGKTCPKAGWQCVDSLCVAGPQTCLPIACQSGFGQLYCGLIGDGCGGTLACACLTAGWTCVEHFCVEMSGGCPKVACAPAGGGRYCGVIGDGCGGTQNCGTTCFSNATCGQSRPNVCGDWPMPDPPPVVTQPLSPPPPPPPPPPCLRPPPLPLPY
jgi:hypothetical protein